jgi:hypothetical protein
MSSFGTRSPLVMYPWACFPSTCPSRKVKFTRRVLGWPRRWKSAHGFLWEYSCKRLKLAQLLGQRGVFLAPAGSHAPCWAVMHPETMHPHKNGHTNQFSMGDADDA